MSNSVSLMTPRVASKSHVMVGLYSFLYQRSGVLRGFLRQGHKMALYKAIKHILPFIGEFIPVVCDAFPEIKFHI